MQEMQAIGKWKALTRPRADDITLKRKNALANQKAKEKWNWRGSGSATTATTIGAVQNCCESPAVMFQVRGCLFSVVTKLSESPKFEACTRWILRGPAHNKTLLAISRQERKGWQWVGKAATVSNWDISWAATLEVGYSILHDVLLNVTQTCKDNNKKKTRAASYP